MYSVVVKSGTCMGVEALICNRKVIVSIILYFQLLIFNSVDLYILIDKRFTNHIK
eukprot:TRINITY_DN6462_c0_g1_i1.p1 TRINITY_DN6462_c0_g1~~TRINITY_DN6462_c0_g1_i1.p1  ORF type:complete len:55 (-),score=2.26 TRINITY_DN6462_c0_g1_i1:32-196(-)